MAEETFELRIMTPEGEFFNDKVDMVELNTTEGEIGVYKNHVPTTVIVKPGILTITQGSEEKKASLHSGFVEILQDKVTILAEVIEWPEDIDEKRAEEAKARAEERLSKKDATTDVARAEIALLRATTRIQAAKLK